MTLRHWRISEDETGLCTVVETEVYLRSAERVMDREERDAVVDYLAANPLIGDLIPGAGGSARCGCPSPDGASAAVGAC